ncbi:MAG: methionine--tRNA ligase [Thaumarchaeota archaeon]|nr:methionine--tRNA ligase [Candidatus Terraquivivens yellowstonensis]MCL7387908.1 methionine--tRNA ligase [Candidatus Terraquivivens yellowstonensis]MCL7393070.1 methionine--tRNA ligase [Candidatus Terraquivivens yellowstonensis]MCL7395576.1 methionine--tRNA ligase [Candidatus Terraquivivens yellowstonensis]MCL7398498.1 methionine--tRNA ligase [Candidatus Terraquivivens yellowstonensis]
MSQVDISEFKRFDFRVGLVEHAERVAGTDKLIKLIVNFGSFKKRAITGLGHIYEPEHFVGKKFVFLVNLKPKMVRGEVSECMILAAAESEEVIAPIIPERDVKVGSQVL